MSPIIGILSVMMIFGFVTVAGGAQTATMDASTHPATPSGDCNISETRPNLGTLPAGTRVFFLPVLTVEYARSVPSPRTVIVRQFAGNENAQAEIRNGAVYLRDEKQPLATLDSEVMKFRAALQVCMFPPGAAIPPRFAALNPDLVTR